MTISAIISVLQHFYKNLRITFSKQTSENILSIQICEEYNIPETEGLLYTPEE